MAFKLSDPESASEQDYQEVLSEMARIWDIDHTSSEFMRILDWVIAYEEVHPVTPPAPDYGGTLFEGGDQPDEGLHRAQFAVDVSGLGDFAHCPELEDFTCRYVINGYIGDSSEKRYYPARALRIIERVNQAIETYFEEMLEDE